MMAEFSTTFLWVVVVALGLISMAILIIIHKYTQGKPPGMQTQLDLQNLDNCRIWIGYTILSITLLSIGVFYGKLGFDTAQVLMALHSLVAHLILAALTLTLILKGILVFKSDWLEEVPDEKVQKVGRATMAGYAAFLQLTNSVWRMAKGAAITQMPLMNILTEDNQPSFIAPFYGTLLAVLFLVILLALFELKRPVEQDEKRFKGAMYSGLAAGILFLLMALADNYKMISRENVPLLQACSVQIFIGIVQPCLYIMGKDNLKAYALNLITHSRIGRELAFWNYVCCPGKFFTIELKGTVRRNQVLPM